MEWWLILLLIFGFSFGLMLLGMPVAFAFLLVNFGAAYVLWQSSAGFVLLVNNMRNAVSHFTLMPLPLFILLGEVIFQSGMAPNMLDAFDKWLGRLPGRLGLVAVGAGTLFGSLTGTGMATAAMLGTTLVPEMERRGYKKPMSLGPILGSAGLAVMIPPSGMAVVLASLADVSLGRLLIAILIPGLLMALFYAAYTVIRCWLQPSLAPAYDVGHVPLVEKIRETAKYILPFGIVIFLVTGVIFLGIATPTEAAATGALGAIFLVACYGRLTWAMLLKSLTATVRTTVMVLLILMAAAVFSQILAYSQATKDMIQLVMSFSLPPIMLIIAMQALALAMGTVMSTVAILMITLPIYMPIVGVLGFDPVWFSVLLLLNMEMGAVSPPFGLTLFVMKGVTSADTTMGDIYKAIIPYLFCDLAVMALILFFPAVALMLPNMMR